MSHLKEEVETVHFRSVQLRVEALGGGVEADLPSARRYLLVRNQY